MSDDKALNQSTDKNALGTNTPGTNAPDENTDNSPADDTPAADNQVADNKATDNKAGNEKATDVKLGDPNPEKRATPGASPIAPAPASPYSQSPSSQSPFLQPGAGFVPNRPYPAPPAVSRPVAVPLFEFRRKLGRDAPTSVIAAVLLCGIVGAIAWRVFLFGLGYTIIGLVVLAAVMLTAPADFHHRDRVHRWVVLAGIVGLLTIPTIRAADWLVVFCVFVAFAAATMIFVEGRDLRGVLFASLAPWFAPVGGFIWMIRRTPRASDPDRERTVTPLRVVAVTAITLVLLLIFGALFAGADPRFAALFEFDVDNPIPQGVIPGIICGILTMLAVAGATFIVNSGAAYPERPARARGPLWSWAVPVGALLALFIAFLAVQADTLFRGDEFIRDPDGPTYAEYARQGFWQLFFVTLLVIGVLVAVWHVADPRDPRHQRLMRILLGGLGLATLGVAASAIHRFLLYIDAYGATVERVFGIFAESYLALVVVLMLTAGIGMSARRVVPGVVVLTVFATLVFALINPDRLVASINVDRYQQSGKIDLHQLSDLSPDARTQILRLPAHLRDCTLRRMNLPAVRDQDWQDFDLSSHRFRNDSAVKAALSAPEPFAGCTAG